jgi:fatty acid-binding protein DegV
MPPTNENPQAQNFISEIFEIVGKILNTAMSRKPDLLKNAGLAIEQNQSVDSLFKQLASEIKDDSATVTMIRDNGKNYQERIRQALETKYIEIRNGDIPEGSELDKLLNK